MCSPTIALSVGLSAFQGLAMRSAAIQAAEDTFEIEQQAVASAEEAKRDKQLGLSEAKQEKTVAAFQDRFAKRIDTLVATRALLAKGQSGNTINLLLRDEERQGDNFSEKIRQSIESMDRQYLFDIKETQAEYQGIRNRYRANTINAYNQIPSLGSILLNAAASGLNTGIQTGDIG